MFSAWGPVLPSPVSQHCPLRFPYQTPAPNALLAMALNHPAKELGQAQVITTDDRFVVKCEVRHFAPEEITVKTEDGFLIINGSHSERQDVAGGDAITTSRNFSRKFRLPPNSDEDGLTCEIGYLGNLKVTVPRKPDGKTKLHKILQACNFGLGHGHGQDHGHAAIHPPAQPHYQLQAHLPHSWVTGLDLNKKAFTVRLELPQFSPEEITVKTRDDFLIIEGNHKEKDDEGGHGQISRSFTRRYLLPVNADKDAIKCDLDAEGVLKVTVPRVQPKEKEGEEKKHDISADKQQNGVKA